MDRLELYLQSGLNERWLSGWHPRCISAVNQYIQGEEQGFQMEELVRALVVVLLGFVDDCDKWHGELGTELRSIAGIKTGAALP